MKLMEREDTLFSARLWCLFLPLIRYRAPMAVTELMVFGTGQRKDYYYVCPQCGITMEREFMAYCDRCGQCLDWTEYEKVKIVYPGRNRKKA